MLEVGKKYDHGPRGIVYVGKQGNYHLFLEQNCGTKTWHALTAESASSLKLDNNNYFPLNLFTEMCVNCGLEMSLETNWKMLGKCKGELHCLYCGTKNKMCANCPNEATLCKYQDTHHCWMMTEDSEEQLQKYAVANEGGEW